MGWFTAALVAPVLVLVEAGFDLRLPPLPVVLVSVAIIVLVLVRSGRFPHRQQRGDCGGPGPDVTAGDARAAHERVDELSTATAPNPAEQIGFDTELRRALNDGEFVVYYQPIS
ncbi:MAG: hypothetical protein QOD39_311, partial [Mycobacterium sp.]|nr:hypothetical protein [Mycobacterium sp.]